MAQLEPGKVARVWSGSTDCVPIIVQVRASSEQEVEFSEQSLTAILARFNTSRKLRVAPLTVALLGRCWTSGSLQAMVLLGQRMRRGEGTPFENILGLSFPLIPEVVESGLIRDALAWRAAIFTLPSPVSRHSFTGHAT